MKDGGAFCRQVSDFLRAQGSLYGRRIVCAVSGGADSVAALFVMRELSPELGHEIAGACHFEHGIRGEESLEDMRFVQRLCEGLGIPLLTERADIPLASGGKGVETAAREARRAFFRRAMDDLGADVCVLGHHRDDQAETILMQLLRGTHAARGMRAFDGVYLRPLLCVTRAQIEEYLRARGVPHREDRTNRVADNPRNILRIDAMPALKRAYPGAVDALSRYADYVSRDDDALCEEARAWLATARSGRDLRLRGLPSEPVLRRAMADYARENGVSEPDGQLLTRLLALAASEKGARLACRGLRLERTEEGIAAIVPALSAGPVPVEIPGVTEHPATGWRISARLVGHVEDYGSPRSPVQYFDADALSPLVLRSRREGDRMRPFGAGGSKKLKDILIDRKIPRARRDEIPLLAGEAEIVWAVGVARGAPAPVTQDTRRIVRMEYTTKDSKTTNDKGEG